MSYLQSTVVVDAHKRIVVLPKVCSWFLPDFVTKRTLEKGPVVGDCLRVIVHYLSGEAKASLKRMLGEGPYPNVRFQKFAFKCRAFTMMDDLSTDYQENDD